MNTKIKRKSKKTLNILGDGGKLVDNIASGLGIASTALNTAMDSSKVKDTSEIEASIEEQKANEASASTTSGLLAEWDAYRNLKHVNYKDLLGRSTGINILQGALNTGMAGASLGPIGAGAGAVLGGITSLFGGLNAKSRAKKEARRLNAEIDKANQRALDSFNQRAENISKQTAESAALNFASLGGYLYKNGGKIHIKKANRGKFTEYCGGKVTNECIQRGLKSSNPTTRKRANFARNARGWSHAFGGELGTNGTDFTNGVTIFDTGGTHEENPNMGIPQGVDQNGTPNLVEEGEVKYKDYIYSNRLFADKDILKLVGLPKKDKNKSFAYLAEQAAKESKERPNDPISKNGLENSMGKLQVAQELQRSLELAKEERNKRSFATGGGLPKPTYPYIGIDDFLKKDYSLETPSLSDYLGTDEYSIYNRLPKTELPTNPSPTVEQSPTTAKFKNSALRYAPIIGNVIGAATSMLDKSEAPDYSNANSILRARRDIKFNPVSNYLRYNPLDKEFYANRLRSQSGATRRALENASAGNRATLAANLIGLDYNSQNQLGNLYRAAEEYNQAQRERVENFNRGTNQYNSQMDLQAQQYNAASALQAAGEAARMRQLERSRYLQDEAARKESIAANLTGLFDNIGRVGDENTQRSWLQTLAESGVLRLDTEGNFTRSKGGKIKRKKTWQPIL